MHDKAHDGTALLANMAAVAQSFSKKEAAGNPKAQKTIKKEWDRLCRLGTWDESKVRNWADVKNEAKRAGETVHIGRLLPTLVEKSSELEEDNPDRKFKGRVVFDGSDVRDRDRQVALFQELSSSPAGQQRGRRPSSTRSCQQG